MMMTALQVRSLFFPVCMSFNRYITQLASAPINEVSVRCDKQQNESVMAALQVRSVSLPVLKLPSFLLLQFTSSG